MKNKMIKKKLGVIRTLMEMCPTLVTEDQDKADKESTFETHYGHAATPTGLSTK